MTNKLYETVNDIIAHRDALIVERDELMDEADLSREQLKRLKIEHDALLAERDALQAKVEAMEKDAGRLTPPGWLWVTHPDHFEGKPIPVLRESDADGEWYRFCDPNDAMDFDWETRDAEWRIVGWRAE